MGDSRNPLVSIITVVYNSVTTIEGTINSVLNQTYKNIEYIIVDGLSNDGTVDIIRNYENRIAHWISETDKGIYDAMNKGIGMASGELIGIINSDDWYENDAVETILRNYLNYPDVGVFHGLVRYINPKNIVTAVIGFNSLTLGKQMIQHPTCFVNTKIYSLFGKYNLAYKYAADYDFMLKLFESSVKFCFIEVIIANFREGGISSSIAAQKEDYLIKQKFGKISFLRCTLLVSYLNLKKNFLYLKGLFGLGFIRQT